MQIGLAGEAKATYSSGMASKDMARYTTQLGRAAHSARPGRESLSKRLGRLAKQIKARDNHQCQYCGATKESSGAFLHLDHLTPKSEGGPDAPSNLVLSCPLSNSARQAKTLAQWAAVSGLGFTARSIRAQARRSLPVNV